MNRAALSGLFVLLLCTLFPLNAAKDPFSYPLSTVILDAGHGGRDPGTSASYSFAGGTINESDLTLDITKRVLALLAIENPALNLVMTRQDDSYVSLAERCRIAYATELSPQSSVLFVSIHINSAQAREASGFEILTKQQGKRVTFLDEQTPIRNIPLFAPFTALELNRLLNQRNLFVAKTFEEALSQRMLTSRNRGIKERDLYVLNASRVPSVLLELGFLSNEDEARNIVSPAWRQQVANAITEAVLSCM
ncbi:MAG TPA: N-acetylmuramoyl-L-alanine amidase [Sphaerochaeta sp.]|nr:N-acetylmuramoyl-L-alanine amidase [Sphaerochaeta sp.]